MGLDKPNVEKMYSERDIEGLVEALGYKEDISVELYAVIALKRFGNEALEPLIRGLKSKERMTRVGSAILLGELADPRAVEPLIALLQQETDEKVVKRTAIALGKIGDLHSVKPLEKILENVTPTGEYDLHWEITIALQKIKDASANKIDKNKTVVKTVINEDKTVVKPLITDAMLAICAHDPNVLLSPPSNIKSTAESSLKRGLANASLSVDAKTGYILTQGGVNFTTVVKNAKRDLPEQMHLFMEKNGLDIGKYEIKYFSENLRDDIKVFWAAAVRKK